MASNTAGVHYRIVPTDPGGHVFSVSCVIATPDPGGQRLSLPSWIPGSYLVRDFAGHVIDISAGAGGGDVAIDKLDKCTWQVAPCGGPLEIRYRVYANDLSVRGAHLDSTHGYFNGPSVFLRVHGRDNERCTVEVECNPNERFADWHLATSMQRLDAEPHGFGVYEAADYAELIDHPFEMGRFQTQFFEVHGVPHQLVVTGRHHGDLARVARDLKKVCEYQMDLFGPPVPVDRYVFLLTVLGEGYGGLEHRWSSSLMARRNDLPRFGDEKVSEEYRRFLGLASHEYFHLWNVKRIRPAPVAESDLSSEAYTRQLWIFEGITSYYDDLSLYRSGVIGLEDYLALVGNTATSVWSGAGRSQQSLSDASFDAWVKFYKRDENAPNTQVSYYAKGALAALGLDLTIRSRSDGASSLDEVMRAVWREYGQTGTPLPEGRFEEMAAAVAGVPLADYFDRIVRDVEDPPLAELLSSVGLSFRLRPRRDGETKPAPVADGESSPALNVGTRSANDRLYLSTVHTHGPAHRAGLACGDELVAIGGLGVTRAYYHDILSRYRPGEAIGVDVFRRDELRRFPVELDPAPNNAVCIEIDKEAGEAAVEARRRWLER